MRQYRDLRLLSFFNCRHSHSTIERAFCWLLFCMFNIFILFPVNLTKATNSELEKCVENVIKNYPRELNDDLLVEICSFSREFHTELEKCLAVSDMIYLILSSRMASAMPQFLTLCILFVTMPVTVATAERSFSKLKLIKNYLRSKMSQDRLVGLSMISIEHDVAKSLDVTDLVFDFANKKARKRVF